jgi:hypothetical protein
MTEHMAMERKWWTLIVVSAATFMLLMDVTIVIVALPTIHSGLHASFSDVQWVVDAYALTLASVLLTAGSAQSSRGRGLDRRSTATSCRSTSSSASLEADDRPSRTSQPQTRTKMRYSRRRDTDDHDAVRLDPAVVAVHRPCRLLAPHK